MKDFIIQTDLFCLSMFCSSRWSFFRCLVREVKYSLSRFWNGCCFSALMIWMGGKDKPNFSTAFWPSAAPARRYRLRSACRSWWWQKRECASLGRRWWCSSAARRWATALLYPWTDPRWWARRWSAGRSAVCSRWATSPPSWPRSASSRRRGEVVRTRRSAGGTGSRDARRSPHLRSSAWPPPWSSRPRRCTCWGWATRSPATASRAAAPWACGASWRTRCSSSGWSPGGWRRPPRDVSPARAGSSLAAPSCCGGAPTPPAGAVRTPPFPWWDTNNKLWLQTIRVTLVAMRCYYRIDPNIRRPPLFPRCTFWKKAFLLHLIFSQLSLPFLTHFRS